MIYSLSSAALVAASLSSMFVNAAPAALKRQNLNLCHPTPPWPSTQLTGSQIRFSAGNGLFFNATLPTTAPAFTGVELAYKPDVNDWTDRFDWYVQTTWHNGTDNEFMIMSVDLTKPIAKQSSHLRSTRPAPGPITEPWCLTTGGKLAPCIDAISFAIECNDCSDLSGPFLRCSIRESWYAEVNPGACLQWGSSAGSEVYQGVIIDGPYDCPNTVSKR